MRTDTADQELLRRTIRDVVAKGANLDQVSAWDRESYYPREFFRVLAEIGLMGLLIPEDLGGGGGGPVEMVLVGEELSRSGTDLATDYGLCNFLGTIVARHATTEIASGLLDKVMRADARLSIAMTEPNAGSDALAIQTRGRVEGDTVVLSGEKMFCTGAGLPDTTMLVACVTESTEERRRNMSLVLVPNDTPGVEISRLDTVGRKILGTYQVVLDGASVPVGNILGGRGFGWAVLREGLALERLYGCAIYLGCAQTVLDLAVRYARERTQFGTNIGSFQAVSHRLVDAHVEIEAARLLTYEAAQVLASGTDAHAAVSRAKLFGSEAAQRATNTAMQVMGGYGYVREFHMERFWREARIFTVTAGASEIQRNMLARHLGLTDTSPR